MNSAGLAARLFSNRIWTFDDSVNRYPGHWLPGRSSVWMPTSRRDATPGTRLVFTNRNDHHDLGAAESLNNSLRSPHLALSEITSIGESGSLHGCAYGR